MRPVLFDKALHLEEVLTWGRARKLEIPAHMLSPIGLIIPGHCASFLMLTNTSCAYLEPTVANPLLSSEVRNRALDALGERMWALAKEHGVVKLMGYSTLPVVIERAQRHGFQVVEDTLFIKDI
jgi:hypothetical protein